MKAVICTQYDSPEVLKIRDVNKPVPGVNVTYYKTGDEIFGITPDKNTAHGRYLTLPHKKIYGAEI